MENGYNSLLIDFAILIAHPLAAFAIFEYQNKILKKYKNTVIEVRAYYVLIGCLLATATDYLISDRPTPAPLFLLSVVIFLFFRFPSLYREEKKPDEKPDEQPDKSKTQETRTIGQPLKDDDEEIK